MNTIMRRVSELFVFLGLSVLMLGCKYDSTIQVDDVREIDFLNKTGDVQEGQFIGEILGARSIMVYDTLLFVVTSDPNGFLQIFSTNDVQKKLGSFCKQGRAQNEMTRLSFCQAYKKDDHIYLFVIDGGMRICELDITASLKEGYTVVTRTKMRPFVELGLDVFLDNDIDYFLDFIDAYEVVDLDGQQKKAPCKYTLIKGEKQKDLAFFKSAMEVEYNGFVNFPYRGGLKKHPSKNIVANQFLHMDYLLFMDFDKNHYFAVHQKGSITHNDVFHNVKPGRYKFTSSTASENYYFVLYRDGDYCHRENEEDDDNAELLLFDWDGNYIKGFKMDRNSDSMGFDENNKILYTMNSRSEKLYSYDLSPYLP